MRRLSTSFASAALALSIVACGASPESGTEPVSDAPESTVEEAAAEPEVPAMTYEVRGEVRGQSEVQGTRLLKVHHEAIDDFVGVDGEVWGMDSMTMDFPIAEDVSLDGIEEGDKISMTLVVDWLGPVAQQVTTVEELPADTELDYREARTAGDGVDGENGDESAEDADDGSHTGHGEGGSEG